MENTDLSLKAQALAIEGRRLRSLLSGERLAAAKSRAQALAQRTELLIVSGDDEGWLALIQARENENAKLLHLTRKAPPTQG